MAAAQQQDSLGLLKQLNQLEGQAYPTDTELQARIRAYELAERMQVSAPEAVDLTKESDATKALYGLNDDLTKEYGTNLLRARRLVERGVRFIQVVSTLLMSMVMSAIGMHTLSLKKIMANMQKSLISLLRAC